jgi:hypothetical protein
MKRILFLTLPLLMFSCYEIERDCKSFRTGKYEIKYTIDGVEKTGQFIRTDSLNVDYYEGLIDTSSVRWINDCEFVLKKLNPKTNAEKDAIHMKILSTTDSSYAFEYKLAVKKPNRPVNVEKGVAYIVE